MVLHHPQIQKGSVVLFFCFLTIPRNARDRRSLSVCTETRVWCQCQFVRVYRDESLVPVSVCPCVPRRELGASVSLSVCNETRALCQCQFFRVYRDESLVPVSVCPCVTRREFGASVSLSVCNETRAWCQCQFVRV